MNSSALPPTITDQERERVSNAQLLMSKGASGVPALIEMLTDSSWVVRREIVQALTVIGEPSVPALCDVLKNHRDNEARIAAAVDTLSAILVPIENEILSLSDHSNPAVVADVVQVLGRRRSRDSIPVLIKLTKHNDDNVAVGAIEALGRIGGRAAVEALVDTVGTEKFFRTFPAIDVLGRSSDPRAVEPLVKLLSNPTYLPEAARALGRSGEKSAVKALLELLKSPTDAIVRIAALSLWDLRERYDEKSGGDGIVIDAVFRAQLGSEGVRRLSRVLSSADVSEGIALCKLLGAVGNFEASELLTVALDYSPQVATSAAEALRRIVKDADSHLLKAIREGNSGRRIILLPMVNRMTAALDVVKCLSDPNPEVRAMACDTLARIGNGSSVSDIFGLLSDGNLRVVHSAIAAIQSLGTREARQLAVKAFASEVPSIRRSALQILGYFGDDSALQPMLDGLLDPDAKVKEAAIQGLPYVEDPRALEALFVEAKNSNPRIRSLAARALGQVPKGTERVYSMLLRDLSDPDPWVRYYACQSVGRLEYSAATPEVASLLHDEAGQVRVSAVEALSHLNSSEAHRELKRAANFEDIDMRRAALVGLGIGLRIEDLPLILEAANSRDVSTRLIALSAMVNFPSPLVLRALSAAGTDSDEQVRSAAIGLLASRREQEATDLLVHLLLSETTRERAKIALLVFNQNRVEGLLNALQSANDELAPMIVSILVRLEKPESRIAILSAMKFENTAARKAAASALASRRDPQMVSALKEAAENDPDEAVRDICALLLKD